MSSSDPADVTPSGYLDVVRGGSMSGDTICRQVSAVKAESDSLIASDPIVAADGRNDVANFVAVSERVEVMTDTELMAVISEGLDEPAVVQYRKQLRPVVRDILIRALATM
jgi:hypothetical protein